MADSGAVRQRRYKNHTAGNHALCKPGCGGLPPVLPASREVPQVSPASGEMFDPHGAMTELAAQLRLACEANPADAVLAREYRLTLMELAKGKGDDGPDPFAELLAGLSAEVGDPAH